MRLWHEHESITISTGHYITKERWVLTNKLRRVLRLEEEKTLSRSLDAFQLAIEKKFNEIIRIEEGFSLAELKNELKGKTQDKITALRILEIHISYFSRKVNHNERSRATLSKYERSKDLLSNFIKEEYHKEDLGWKSVSGNFINNLELFLRHQSTFKGNIGIRNNSTVK